MKKYNHKTINELRRIIKNKKGGTVLLMTLLILMSILVVTLAAGEIVRMGLIMSRTQVHSTKAYYASEAGAERILWEIRKKGLVPGDGGGFCENPGYFCYDIISNGNIISCQLDCNPNPDEQILLSNDSIYKIKFDYAAPTTTLSCLGDYKEIRRVVELKY